MARHDATTETTPHGTVIEEPRLVTALLNDVRWSWVWLGARIYVGWQCLESGWAKLQSPEWMRSGLALKTSWEHATQVPQAPGSGFGWYRGLLQYLLESGSYGWAAKLIAVGETLIGIALILGFLTGIVAILSTLISFNLVLSGGGALDPLIPALTIGLVMAWKTAGWIGFDRWLLPVLGTPWRRGLLFRHAKRELQQQQPVEAVRR